MPYDIYGRPLTPEAQVAALSDQQMADWYPGQSRQTITHFYRFCHQNPELTSLAGPLQNAWADFIKYRDTQQLDIDTGTILLPDGTPKPKGPWVIVLP